MQIKQNSDLDELIFFMADSTDHTTGKTGLSPTVTIRKRAGSFASPSGTVTEIANGFYKVAAAMSDNSLSGALALHATATGADPTDSVFDVIAGIRHSTAQSGAASSITLDSSASSTDRIYNGLQIMILSGTGAGQTRRIVHYIGSSKIAYINTPWTTNTDNTSVFLLQHFAQIISSLSSGLAQGGGANTITLGSHESSVSNTLAGGFLKIAGGTGIGQVQTIVSYGGSTKVATLCSNWLTNPDSTSIYEIIAGDNIVDSGTFSQAAADKVWFSTQSINSTLQANLKVAIGAPIQYLNSLPIASIVTGTMYEASTPGNLNSVITESGGADVSATNCSFGGMTITGSMTGGYYFSLLDSIFKKGFINSYTKIMGGSLIEDTEINSDIEVGATNPTTKYRNVFRNCHWNTMNVNDTPSVVNLSTTGAAGVIEIVDCSGQIKFDVLGGYSNPYIIYVRNFKGKITFSSSMSISQTFHFNGLHGVVDGTIGYAQIIIDGQNRSHILYVAPASNYDVNAHTDYAVAPLAIEANVESHVSNKLIAYDSNGGVAKQSVLSTAYSILSNSDYGNSALKTLIDSANSVLSSGSYGNAALLTAIQNVQNGTFISATVPAVMERQDSSYKDIPVTILFADETGSPKNLDSGNPVVTIFDESGTDISSRMVGSWTNPTTGTYVKSYHSSATDPIEGLNWSITGTVNSKLRKFVQYMQLVDTTAINFTSTDRTMLTSAYNKTLPIPIDPTSETNATANKTDINAHTDSAVAALATETHATTNKQVILDAITALPVFDDEAVQSILAWVSNGQNPSISRYVNGEVSTSGNGKDWITPFKTIKEFTDLCVGGVRGICYVKYSSYHEDVVLPEGCILVGIAVEGLSENPFPEIRGDYTHYPYTNNPSLILKAGAKVIGFRVGKQSGMLPSPHLNCLISLDDNAEFISGSTGGINPSCDKVINLTGFNCVVKNNNLDTSGSAINTIAGKFDTATIEDNTFTHLHGGTDLTQNYIKIDSGSGAKIRENKFVDIKSGCFAISGTTDNVNVRYNTYNGAGDLIYKTNLGANSIVENNGAFDYHLVHEQDIIVEGAVAFLVTYDVNGTTIKSKQPLKTFDGNNIASLVDTTKPSRRGKSIV